MKFAFITCVEIGLNCIKEIYRIGSKLDLVISLSDEKSPKKSGRVYLDEFCDEKGIELFKVNNINDSCCQKKIADHEIDWLFIIGWSQIAKPNLLKAPKKGIIGAHPTLLPQGRGRASIPWAILKNLKYTGVSFFKINEGVDTGEIISQNIIKLKDNETASSLYKKVIDSHKKGISKIIPKLINSKITLLKQNELNATYWPGRKPEDGEINLLGSVYDAERLIRATTKPYPGAYFFRNSQKIIIWKAKILKKDFRNEEYPLRNMLEFKDGLLNIEEMDILN
tara:strand:+ start:2554 stop:3396 length:843 start_codon:yes stop_codon:yes gene_type:complete